MVGGRLDSIDDPEAVDAVPLHAQRNDRTTPQVIAAVDQKALATCRMAWSRTTTCALEPHHADAHLDQPHLRQPGGDERPQSA